MPDEKANIAWTYSGKADFLLGTGATKAEQALGWAAGLMGASLYGYLYLTQALNWTGWQTLVAAFLAFDIIGGVVANSLNSCKRFYHTPAKPDEPPFSAFFKNHLTFSALHIHPLLIAVLFGAPHYFYGVFWYLFLVAGTLVLMNTPLYLKRPLAFFMIAFAMLLNGYVVFPAQGFEWFVPMLMIKILYGHGVREEPYRPIREG